MIRPAVKSQSVSTSIPFRPSFLPLAMAFVDKGARGFGYGDVETAGLVLAVEELFSFYLQHAGAGAMFDVELEDQAYRMALILSFPSAKADMHAFNLTWNANPNKKESLERLGPMLAARSVSNLWLDFGENGRIILHMTRDRDYAPAGEATLPPADVEGPIHFADPSPDDLSHFAAMAATAGPPFLPVFLYRPGMAADMLAGGHLNAILAVSGSWILGGVLWRPLTASCLELYGPYLFREDPDDSLLALLLDEAVVRISRSGYHGILRRQGALPGYGRFFDFLGELELTGPDQAGCLCTYYFRQLQEESGGLVYCTGQLADFLKRQYDRLCLPRQVRKTVGHHSGLRDTSVIAIEMEQERSLAIIRPLCAGKDMVANLLAHIDLLQRNRIRNILAEINTGRSEDTIFAVALEKTNFLPCLLIPDAGKGDLVIYGYLGQNNRS